MGFKSEYDQNPHFAQRKLGILVLRIFAFKKKVYYKPHIAHENFRFS